MHTIRQAKPCDLSRISEIEIFNYRLHFYPIFKNDDYYFGDLQVTRFAQDYERDSLSLSRIFVYDDGVVKGFVSICGSEIKKLFVEPVLQGQGIGAALLTFAIEQKNADFLWALEKNTRAIAFYQRHGFQITGDRKPEEDTTEYLVRLTRTPI